MTIVPNLSNRKLISSILILPLLIITIIIWQYSQTLNDDLLISHTIFLPISESHHSIFLEAHSAPNNQNYLKNMSNLLSSYNLYEMAVYTALTLGLIVLIIGAISLFVTYKVQNAKNYTSTKQLYRVCHISHILFPILLTLLLSSTIILVANLLIIFLLRYTAPLYTLPVIAITLSIVISINWQLLRGNSGKDYNEELNLIGIRLTREKAPLLWQFVEMIAKKGRLQMPDNIVIGMNHCFFVTESPISLWGGVNIQEGSTLYLPIPYMHYMDHLEVAAIISHELTHLTYEDTKHTQKFFIISQKIITRTSILNIQQPLQKSGLWDIIYSILVYPTLAFAEYFLDSYHQTIQHWKRTRETHADRISAIITSKEQMSNALLRVALITPAVEYIVNEYWFAAENQQQTILQGIQSLLKRHGFPDPLMQLQSIQNHPLDNHPTLQKRLQLLNINITDKLLEKATQPRHSQLLTQLALLD